MHEVSYSSELLKTITPTRVKSDDESALPLSDRLPLPENEAGIAQSAITAARQRFDPDPRSVMERLRKAVIEKAWREGIE